MRTFLFLLVSAAAACGASDQQLAGPARPSGSVPGVAEAPAASGPARFATRPECDRLVDHLDAVKFLSFEERNAWRARNQDPEWHRSRVDECTIKVTERDYQCLMQSRDLGSASLCNNQFFADTLRSYRYR